MLVCIAVFFMVLSSVHALRHRFNHGERSLAQIYEPGPDVVFFHDAFAAFDFISGTTRHHYTPVPVQGDTQGFLRQDFPSHRWGRGHFHYVISNPMLDSALESDSDQIYASGSHLMPGSKYTIRLGFAEVYTPNCAENRRVMDISVNGAEFASNLDVFKMVGCETALVLEKDFVVDESATFDIDFSATKQNAMISIIEIIEAASDPPTDPPSTPSCQPTNGECASTFSELESFISLAEEGDSIAICDGATIETQLQSLPVILSASSLTLCCMGTGCTLSNTGMGRNLVVLGTDATIQGIEFIGGAAPKIWQQYEGKNVGPWGGNLYLKADGDHSIIDCKFQDAVRGNFFATIYPAGTLAIRGSSFRNGTGTRAYASPVYIEGTSETLIEDSEFTGNIGSDPEESETNNDPALAISSMLGELPKISILNTVFEDNVGGAAHILEGPNLDLTLFGNSGSGNTADSDFGVGICDGISWPVVPLCFAVDEDTP